MSNVLTEKLAGGVTRVTLNRPESLNAMSYQLVLDLHAALDAVQQDRECRVVILTGAGRGFCAGFDINNPGPEPGAQDLGRVQRMFGAMDDFYGLISHMRALRQPVIAAVNGAASGGGFAIALGADIRVASTAAKFNAAFIRVGYSACDIGVSYLLPRLVGSARATELMLTGRLFDAEEALRIGLVLEVTPPEGLMAAAERVAQDIARNSPLGVEMTKEVLQLNIDAPSLEAAIALEKRTNILTTFTEDRQEAIDAFREKRPPNYRHR
jgi:enoyl-CoA hydratase